MSSGSVDTAGTRYGCGHYCGNWDISYFFRPGQFFFMWSSSTTKAPNKRVAPVSVGHSNPSPDGPRAPTQTPSKDKEERLCKGTYIGLKRKFNEGGRVQDWLSLFFAFVDSLYMQLVRNDDMAVSLGYWVPFTSWYASSCPVGAPLARLEARAC